MKATLTTIGVFLGLSLAHPTALVTRSGVCVGLGPFFAEPYCCTTADEDCKPPTSKNNIADFQASCNADGGKKARCCTALGNITLICRDPNGV